LDHFAAVKTLFKNAVFFIVQDEGAQAGGLAG
jgi:hypothetical protein